MTKILVFGDSIAWGAFDTEKGGWVERLKINYFNEPEIKYHVYNLAISSNDTRGILFELKKIMQIIEKVESDEYIYIYSVGSNDCRYKSSKENKVVREGEFMKNLNKIIKITKKYSSKIFFTGLLKVDESKTMPIPWAEEEYYANDDIQKYNDLIEETCKKNGLNFIKLIDLLNEEDLFDGVHPTAEGHRKIFERIKGELNKIPV